MAELYDRFGRLAFSVIVGIVRDSAAAEDLTQETFLRVWNRMQGFDSNKGALGAWLLAVARNRAIDYVRSVGHALCTAIASNSKNASIRRSLWIWRATFYRRTTPGAYSKGCVAV